MKPGPDAGVLHSCWGWRRVAVRGAVNLRQLLSSIKGNSKCSTAAVTSSTCPLMPPNAQLSLQQSTLPAYLQWGTAKILRLTG